MKFCSTVATDHFGAIPIRHRNCPLCDRNNDDLPPTSDNTWAVLTTFG